MKMTKNDWFNLHCALLKDIRSKRDELDGVYATALSMVRREYGEDKNLESSSAFKDLEKTIEMLNGFVDKSMKRYLKIVKGRDEEAYKRLLADKAFVISRDFLTEKGLWDEYKGVVHERLGIDEADEENVLEAVKTPNKGD